MIFLLFLFFAISIVLAYLLFLAQNKIDIYEEWILEFQNDINDVYQQLKSIDDKNIFEKDDDVGVAFTEIVSIIDKLNQRIEKNVNNEKEINKKETRIE